MCVVPCFAASDDYVNGYNQGYADALAGKTNPYTASNNLDSDTETGYWEARFFVDSFGDYTEDGYVITERKQYGTFTNSTTKNSELKWELLVDELGQAQFFLYEYGDYPVTGSSSYPTEYTISVKKNDGTILTFTGTNDYDRIAIDSNCLLDFWDLLMSGESFKIIIEENSSYYSSKYNLGVLNSSGFANVFNATFPDFDREYVELLIKLYELYGE